jgi:alkyl sulfatase BDS1-like metallo-beta-lactamase superfamily hydrolase
MSIKQFFSFEGAVVCLGLIIFSVGCTLQTTHRPIPAGANQYLVAHSKIFRKGIETVTENVHAAIGYGISNCVMIEGDDGVIIVDTMTTREEAIEVLAEFRKISSKPVRAIIYTHSHPDHVFGADVFAEGSDPAVYAHETTEQLVKQLLTEAVEIRDRFLVHETARPSAASIRRFDLSGFFDSLAVNLDPEKSAAVDQKILMEFPDAGESFAIHVRHGVAEIRKRAYDAVGKEEYQLHVVAEADAWKEMLAKLRNPVTTMAGFHYEKGNAFAFASFITPFKLLTLKLPLETF